MSRANAVRHRKAQRALIDKLEPMVAKAYADSVADLRDSVVISQVVEALERKDIEGAIDALNIEAAAFSPLRKALALAYEAGGNLAVNTMPRLVARN